MFDTFKRIFRPDTEAPKQAASAEENEQTQEREPVSPTTLEEAVGLEVERLKRSIENDAKEYEAFLAGLNQPDSAKQNPSLQEPKPPEPPAADDLSSRILKRLGNEPTVESFVKAIVEELVSSVNIQAKQTGAVPYLGDTYAELVVNRVIRKYPYLSSVAEDGLGLLRRMSPEQINEELADWVLHALKGRRAEAEKKEALANLFEYDTVSGSAAPTVENLPQERELREFAENMGVDPDKLKKRLLEAVRAKNK